MTTPRELGCVAACVAHRTGTAPPNPYPPESPQAIAWGRGFDSEMMKIAAEEEQKEDHERPV